MSSFNELSARLLDSLQRKVVALDYKQKEKLNHLDGKIFEIEVTDWQVTYYFLFTDQIQITSTLDASQKANAKLSGSSFAFIKMAQEERQGSSLLKGELHFTGEVGLAQQFQKFWQTLNPDFEEAIAGITGDVFAHGFVKAAKGLHHFALNTLSTLSDNFAEYTQEEARLTPSQEEQKIFFDAVDELRAKSERLAARIQRIENNKS